MEYWKDNEEWKKIVGINDSDPYSKATVDVARMVMEKLDDLSDEHKFAYGYYPKANTVHTIITEADDDVKAGGITGAMTCFAISIVRKFHRIGEAFYLANKNNRENYKKERDQDQENL